MKRLLQPPQIRSVISRRMYDRFPITTILLIIIVLGTGCGETKKESPVLPSQKSLDNMMSSINRIRVIDAGMMNDKAMKGEILLDTRNVDEVSSFKSIFSIVEADTLGGVCACLGGPTFEFYNNESLVATISLHHGSGIRWYSWGSDAVLKSPKDVLDWLARNNVKKPKQEYEEMLRWDAEMKKREQKWLAATPKCLRPRWDKINWSVGSPSEPTEKTLDELWGILKIAYPKQEDFILILLKWYGTGGTWSGYPIGEDVPKKLLFRIDTQVIVKAITTHVLSSSHMEGIARYFDDSAFQSMGKKCIDKKLIPDKFKQKILNHVRQQKDKHKINEVECHLYGLWYKCISSPSDPSAKTVYNHITPEGASLDYSLHKVYRNKFKVVDVDKEDGFTPAKVIAGTLPKTAISEDGQSLEGYVLVLYLITDEGRVAEPMVIKTTDKRLDQTALKAMEQWRFVPASKKDKPFDRPVWSAAAQEVVFKKK